MTINSKPWMTRPLRSAPITGASSLLRDGPPLCSVTGTQLLVALHHSKLSLSPRTNTGDVSGTTGSRVPSRSPDQAHATYTPDTAWAVNRFLPDFSQRQDQPSVLMSSTISTLQQWFAHARLLGPHLTRSRRVFSASLPTPALNRRSMRWFQAISCKTAPEGLPPSPAQLHTSAEPDLHRLPLSVLAAHDLAG